MKHCFVGFDTSNYTTSAAVCSEDGEILANLKIPLPVKDGDRGLRQSDAVFAHVKNLPALCSMLERATEGMIPLAVGVSVRPRDAEDSYMPCFLSGKAAASSFATAAKCPISYHSHQNGHVMAALYSSGQSERLLQDSFFAFHVSGGTTEGLLVTPKTDGELAVRLLTETADLNAGQVIDRVGVSLGLSFPCGKELEQLAASYTGKPYRHPISVKDGRCSLSGAENIAARLYGETGDASAVAAFVFDFLERTIEAMTAKMQEHFGPLPVLYAGGVMSNLLMRDKLSACFDACFSDAAFSADNAAGIALLCKRTFQSH
ncbi:MAG: peptidase M22 [Clostridia bacterium]|nr:peptidase M22 [Clostridia bacterium]